jgi:hypothetical protein
MLFLSTHAAEPPHRVRSRPGQSPRFFHRSVAGSEGAQLFSFTELLSQLVELVDGSTAVAVLPTKNHQQVVHALLTLLL